MKRESIIALFFRLRKQQFVYMAFFMLLFNISNQVKAQDMNEQKLPQNLSAFPIGEDNVAFQQYFTGKSFLAVLTHNNALNCPINNVTFEPGCRNNWHSHTGGQILIAVGGKGYYQEKGKPARLLLPGDIVEIAPNVVHWHGAAPDSWFSHLAVECNPQTNQNTWYEPVDDDSYAEATTCDIQHTQGTASPWFPIDTNKITTTDPELAEMFYNFAFSETQQYGNLNVRTRILVTMASAIALNAHTEYRQMVEAALANGITPIEIKEVLYHTVAYAGMSKVRDMLDVANEVMTSKGITLPLEPQSVVSPDTRMEEGRNLQEEIFTKANIDNMYASAPANQLHFQEYLSDNCFGDYQTRPVFDAKMRELLTFSILISLGGCEPQVKGHIQGNVNVGNDKAVLLSVVTQLLPYIGYPRTLNAVACLNEVIPETQK